MLAIYFLTPSNLVSVIAFLSSTVLFIFVLKPSILLITSFNVVSHLLLESFKLRISILTSSIIRFVINKYALESTVTESKFGALLRLTIPSSTA